MRSRCLNVGIVVVAAGLAQAHAVRAQSQPSVTVASANATVMARPQLRGEVIATFQPGASLELIGMEDDWFWVLLARDTYGTRRPGWIHASLIEGYQPPPASQETKKAHKKWPRDAGPAQAQRADAVVTKEQLQQTRREQEDARRQEKEDARRQRAEAAKAKKDTERLQRAERDLERARRNYQQLMQPAPPAADQPAAAPAGQPETPRRPAPTPDPDDLH